MMDAEQGRPRSVIARTSGSGHGPIVRLVSPSDLARLLKPFVFLDLFETDTGSGAMPIHPHSGIATVTVLTEGDVRFEDARSGSGTIGYGGVEWLRAGKGVWHGQEMSAGASAGVRGFQLWVALPPALENGPVDSQYIEADQMPVCGPATVILGRYGGEQSPVRCPEGITCLLVTLQAGETWQFTPPAGQHVAFLAISRGEVAVPDRVTAGELVALEHAAGHISILALGDSPAVFVLGSATAHPHELHLGSYSVHTSAAALAIGENHIADLRHGLRQAGDRRQASGASPVFR